MPFGCPAASGRRALGARCAKPTALLLLSGIVAATIMPLLARAKFAAPTQSISARYAVPIAEAAARFRLPTTWIRAVIGAESNGDPRARSPRGAMGLMQIMPRTWADLRKRQHLGSNPNDPRDNIIAGACYIRELFDRYGWPGWIAAYNAGPRRYEASLAGRPVPLETRAYVANVVSAIEGRKVIGTVVARLSTLPQWRRAALFAAPSDRRFAGDPTRVGHPSSAILKAAFVHDVSAIEPQSGDLFVARSVGRNAP
ncbi:lytic transglycosylase domain-containing protein [Labrys okinawensis]|uniref:lytic transglycosylase domain-containing protein n=1 Tax=Labrys okinawensis TaxID=346911 RepID=UPI0039BC2AB4